MDIKFIIGALVGVLLTIFVFLFGINMIKRFIKNAKLIRNYWIFIGLFSLVCVATYWVILSNPIINDKNLAISVANQASGLIFAIFTGYFAFSQVMEGRFEKLDAEGLRNFGAGNITEAIKSWELASTIKRKDPTLIANLLEAYAVNGEYAKIKDQIELLKKITPPEKEEVPFIILTTMYLFMGYIGDATDSINETVRIIESKDPRTYYSRWEFKNIKKSQKYLRLQGDAKKLFDNYVAFILRVMPEDDRARFISGNLLLARDDTGRTG